jgi:hypothetical protein
MLQGAVLDEFNEFYGQRYTNAVDLDNVVRKGLATQRSLMDAFERSI